MKLVKCRVVLEDTPGALGRISSALGVLGCNIDEIDVQDVDGRQILDDILVETPHDVDTDSLSDTLLDAGAQSVRILPATEPVTDRQTAAFDAAARLLDAALAGDVDAETHRLLARQAGLDADAADGHANGPDDVSFTSRAMHERYTATEIGRIRAMLRLRRKAEAIATKLDRAGGADPSDT